MAALTAGTRPVQTSRSSPGAELRHGVASRSRRRQVAAKGVFTRGHSAGSGWRFEPSWAGKLGELDQLSAAALRRLGSLQSRRTGCRRGSPHAAGGCVPPLVTVPLGAAAMAMHISTPA